MQTVQVPSVSYQTVQVPVHIQKEIVEVEKPVPVPQPVPIEPPPKPYVKEAVYARPFQKSQKYIKTRITPLEEVTEKNFIEAPTTTTTTEAPIIGQVHHVDLTEENLYFANKKRKIVTRFIKIEEMYEAESFEEVGIFYDFGPSSNDDFELKVTRIFEVDQPVLVKNETVTSRVTYLRSPTHVVNEYMNGKLEHSYHAGNPHALFNGRNASEDHFHRFHPYGSHSFMISHSFGAKSPDYHKYTQFMNGREVEIEERTTELPGGHALFIEKRIRAVRDISPFPESIEAVPSFETTIQNGKEVLVFTLTYDSTRKTTHTKYGIASSQTFGSEFSSFLNEFKKYIPSKGAVYDRLKRSLWGIRPNVPTRKRRSVDAPVSESGRSKRTPLNQIEYHNKIYKLKTVLPLKGYNPGGYIYRSDDGHEIKVEEETITNIEGGPKNEYLRYSQVYVPRQKVKYEVAGLLGTPADSYSLKGMGTYLGGNFQSYPFPSQNVFEQGFSYKTNNPFYYIQ